MEGWPGHPSSRALGPIQQRVGSSPGSDCIDMEEDKDNMVNTAGAHSKPQDWHEDYFKSKTVEIQQMQNQIGASFI